MKYDFDEICSRENTNCSKWDRREAIFGSNDIIPMWVADMDFSAARPIIEALQERATHEFYGYTEPGDSLIEAIVERMEGKFDWRIDPEWIVFTPGVVPAINIAIRSLARPGDEIILQEPAYFPFFNSVRQNGCQIATNELKLSGGRYQMDFEDLESKFHPKLGMRAGPNRVRALVLCNPHNPIGRVWDREDLTRMGEIVVGNGATVISDEIHCEILFKGNKHTSFATISKEFEQNCIICMAPSKTFNLAGLHASSIIIPNKKLRDSFNDARAGVGPPNLFGYVAMEAAYRHGDEWLEQMLDYLDANLKFTLEYFGENIPRIKVIVPQGTYLLWLDCRELGLDDMALRDFMREKAKVGFDDGFIFGSGGRGFQRMNIACPQGLLEEALNRIETAVSSL
ncbi:MAG: MalY/PatB family protein [Dehalococcoidales bacterium]|jgi:cystathionine beta-lyase|nr:MalY/PatB family protein [Dehalococcoidales bacterium]MDP7525942.1 MalY/PatB family protein [Dehalococcoidales bacterium]